MFKLEYNGEYRTVQELSEMSGIKPATIRDRLRRGYSVYESVQQVPTDDSVIAFTEASWWQDWIGMSISYLHKIYSNWCSDNGYTPIHIQRFSMQLIKMYPNLKVTPKRTGKDMKPNRIIIER